MTRREKIILAATGIVAVIGFGSLFMGDKPAGQPGKPQVAQTEAVGKIRDDVMSLVRQATAGKTESALMAAIEKPWRSQVFYDKPLEAHNASAKPTAIPRFTGYVELGSGRLAVIDGYEYQAGDSLEGGGYKVLAVSPDKVTLESLANGQKLELPYDGQESQGR
ncbi:hypothetical protein [Desulfovibrio sp. TomC]|uniref:hypothetical protein n=1 Tax=Desulfovibrio sp. TomC TaxID=1562888 RepID=UPI000575AB81|nr:hypothetical protein [Desulfovibrio sp. TomC]KHK02555.1 hypothetical protein NY78_1912 [Desulfovibrio sp. TomC]